MSSALIHPVTVEDYKLLPESGPRYQLIEGELFMTPAPNLFHQQIIGNLYLIMREWATKNGGVVFLSPCDVFLSDINALQPDLLYVSAANVHLLAEDGIHGAPDVVMEVLSPSTAQLDKRSKRPVYARAGVRELWFIDPLLLQIQIYDLATDPSKPIRFIEENETFSSLCFGSAQFSAADVFKR